MDLVLFAFEHGVNGDLFVQKAPAATIGTLAQAILELSGSSSKMQVIGTRHGEKKFETLVTREEMDKAIDMGDYYRIPADTRDLNYDKYFVEGKKIAPTIEDYDSNNTKRLDVEGMKKLLLKLACVREAFGVAGA